MSKGYGFQFPGRKLKIIPPRGETIPLSVSTMAETTGPKTVTASATAKGILNLTPLVWTVLDRINNLDSVPTPDGRALRRDVVEISRLKPDWRDPRTDTVDDGAHRYLVGVLDFLHTFARVPRKGERDRIRRGLL